MIEKYYAVHINILTRRRCQGATDYFFRCGLSPGPSMEIKQSITQCRSAFSKHRNRVGSADCLLFLMSVRRRIQASGIPFATCLKEANAPSWNKNVGIVWIDTILACPYLGFEVVNRRLTFTELGLF